MRHEMSLDQQVPSRCLLLFRTDGKRSIVHSLTFHLNEKMAQTFFQKPKVGVGVPGHFFR